VTVPIQPGDAEAPVEVKPLAFPFTKSRFVHRLIERQGDVCLVERENLVTGSKH
jgi:hypothetical protein